MSDLFRSTINCLDADHILIYPESETPYTQPLTGSL